MQTTPGLRDPGDAPPERASQAPQRPRNTDAPTVSHIRRLPTRWSHRHLADRFMWLNGAVGVVDAFYGGENHGYLTFRTNAQAVAACAVVSAALGTVAPPLGRLLAAIHCVNHGVMRGLTVYTQRDAPAEGRRETLPAQEAPPRTDRPPLTEADVRRLIADTVSQPPRVVHTQARPPTQLPAASTAEDALRPLPKSPPRPGAPSCTAGAPLPGPDTLRPESQAAAPELQQRRAAAPLGSPTPQNQPQMAGRAGFAGACPRRPGNPSTPVVGAAPQDPRPPAP